jgi:hypothetical protein
MVKARAAVGDAGRTLTLLPSFRFIALCCDGHFRVPTMANSEADSANGAPATFP